MMKKSWSVTGILLSSLLWSACCRDLNCPAFDSEVKATWMPQGENSNLIFQSVSGNESIVFTVSSNTGTSAYKKESHWAGITCTVNDCDVKGDMAATTIDTSFGVTNKYIMNIRSDYSEDKEYDKKLEYTIGDFSTGFQISPQLSLIYPQAYENWEADSLVTDRTLGTRTYDQLIIQTKKVNDTAQSVLIRKVYLSPGYGLVGFEKKDGTLFLLK